MRTPVFELHIKPLIRIIDRESMLWAFDLYDYDQVVEHAEKIADRASVDMPPASEGGPWPEEFIDLFRRWMETGFKRLEVGSAEYSWAPSTGGALITAKGTFPSPGYKGWLQLESDMLTARTYNLYFEAPDSPVSGNSVPFSIREKYKLTGNQEIFIKDRNGTHKVH